MTMSGSSAYHQVNSSSGMEGELNGPLFAGDHGPEGVWQSEKGSMLTPMELSFSVQDTNYNDGRVDSNGMAIASGGGWEAHGPVESGPYDPNSLTRGTDKHMPK